jgi:hypothetical protein
MLRIPDSPGLFDIATSELGDILPGTRPQRSDDAADGGAVLQAMTHGHIRVDQIAVTPPRSAPGEVTVVLESVDDLLHGSDAEVHPLGNELCGALGVSGQVDQHAAVVGKDGPIAFLHTVRLHRGGVDATRAL